MNKYIIGVIVLIAIAVARIASTYTIFNSTYDEPDHVVCGMEWLQRGTYTCDIQHPPLARIAVALGPYLKGLRLARLKADQRPWSFFDEGNAILYSQDDYWANLTWARLGTLPFLVLLCVVTFVWARRWFCKGFGESAGFWAVLLLVCTSPILGHAGLATNDVACAAGAALALYQFLRWLEEPRTVRWLWWGFATALAVLCKFSNIPFLVTCYAVGLIFVPSQVTSQAPRGTYRRRFAQIALSACVVLTLAWAVYRFRISPPAMLYGQQQHPVISSILSRRPLLNSVWNTFLTTPLPLSEAMIGVMDLFVHNSVGQDSYLLGHWGQFGWWYFFPVVIAMKSPIGLLVLAMCGWWIIFRRWREAHWRQGLQQILTVVFPLVILVICMAARVNLGVRHILPIYPLLAIAGGHAVATLFRHSRYAAIVAALLVAWVVGDSVRAHADYLAHFNEFAGSHPEAILCESDLDWGQDLHRLSLRLKERGIQDVSIAYFGTARLDQAGLPHYALASAALPSRGYVAVSLHGLNIDYRKDGSFAWLKSYTPIERIGKSIDLFYIAP